MKVVSDTTVISNLVQIGEINLLMILFGQVFIPEGVHNELQVLLDRGLVKKEELEYDWIIIRKIKNWKKLTEFLHILDRGESEAILLGLELNSDCLLIDEKQGRIIAADNGLTVKGTLGVLLEAKKRKLIVSVSDRIKDLRSIGFWINDPLYLHIIELEKHM